MKRQGRQRAAAPRALVAAARRRAVIDLHLHTTASDGRLDAPRARRSAPSAAGLRVMAVTDHDTTAAVAEVQAARARARLEAVAGIEITAVVKGRDVHMLGYFIDIADAPFQRFVAGQRAARDRAARGDRRAAGRAGHAGAD